MTKTEIREQLQAKGLINTNGSRDPLWVAAFQACNEGRAQKLKMGCGSCYNEVRKWLLS